MEKETRSLWCLIAAACLLAASVFGCDRIEQADTGQSARDASEEGAEETGTQDTGTVEPDTEADPRDTGPKDVGSACSADANERPLPGPMRGRLFALERDDGAVSVDGQGDEIEGRSLQFSDPDGASDDTVTMASRWTSSGLYLGFEVEDGDIETPDEADAWTNDGVEIAVDPDASGGDDFAGDEHKWVVEANGDLRAGTAEPGYWGTVDNPVGIEHTATETDAGYRIELLVEWSVLEVTPEFGDTMGFLVRANDRDGGEVEHVVDKSGGGLAAPSSWGTLEFAGESCRYDPDGGGMDTGVADADTGTIEDTSEDAPLDVGPNTRVLREDKNMGHSTLEVASGETLLIDGDVTLTWDGFNSDRGALAALDIAGTVRFANEGDTLILDQTAENLGLSTQLRAGARFGDGKGTIIFRGEVDLLDVGKSGPGPHFMLFPPQSGKAVVNGVAWPDGSGAPKQSGDCAGNHASNIGFSWAGYEDGDLVMKNTLIWGFSHNLFYWRAHHGSLTLIDSSIEHNGSRGISIPEEGLEMRNVTLNIGGKNAYQLFSCGAGLTGFQVETDDGSHREAHLDNVHVLSRAERYDGKQVRYPSDGGLFGRYYMEGGTFTFHLNNSHSEAGKGSPSHVTLDGSWGDNARRLDHEIVDRVTGSN